MDIHFLADHPDAVETLGAWTYHEWHHLFPESTEETFRQEFIENSQRDTLPLSIVALDHGEVCGTASLVPQDGLPEFAHLTPWLASVYVASDRRKQGLGAQLVARILEIARTMGFSELYLWTENKAAWYTKQGWHTVAVTEFRGIPITVMRFPL